MFGWWSLVQGVFKWGLQCVWCLVVRGWFLKWNCFFIVWVRRLVDFRTRWCVEAGGVGTKLRPRASTSVSVGDSWWEKTFLMSFFSEIRLEFLKDPALGEL